MHPIQGTEYLERLAQRIYFPVDNISTGELAVFYGLMYNGIREILEVDQTPDIPAIQLQHYQGVCQKAFEAKIQAHELFAVPTYENALALTIAVSQSMSHRPPTRFKKHLLSSHFRS